ncbi:MAG: glycosyltransferase family 9 protein [Dysgonamonadaceae bacterium]|jgi:ADP-heptose:LPS heptosyltransferase|nr:glycosyltransferase family 9 protein [Dysgonamonadaceae bacterium]
MSRVLVLRLSALGDVAMLIPVLYSAAGHYPEDEFLLATKSPLLPIFEHRPDNVRIIPVFSKDQHKGLKGLARLIRELSAEQIDLVADTHDVLRSQQIRRYFRLKGKKVEVIDKGRWEKWKLTCRRHKDLHPLKTSIERYHDVFKALGYDFPIDFQSIFEYGGKDFSSIEHVVGKKEGTWIGIAPFAKHKGKSYPLEKMEKVLEILIGKPQTTVFLFGGKEEEEHLEMWAQQHEHVISVAGHFSFSSELLVMSCMDVMLTMDSGNMHLASLVNVPVVSIWGATHPYTGFCGYRQNPDNCIAIDTLPCRPCSVFGDKKCFRKDYACLQEITPERVAEQIGKQLKVKSEK